MTASGSNMVGVQTERHNKVSSSAPTVHYGPPGGYRPNLPPVVVFLAMDAVETWHGAAGTRFDLTHDDRHRVSLECPAICRLTGRY